MYAALQDMDNEVKYSQTFSEDSSETCSGDTCSADDDETISLCSWTTDLGEWRCEDQEMGLCTIPNPEPFIMGALPMALPQDMCVHSQSVPVWYAPTFIPMTAVCIAMIPGSQPVVASGCEEDLSRSREHSPHLPEAQAVAQTEVTTTSSAREKCIDTTKELSCDIAEKTTVFLRNIPAEGTRDSLLQVLDAEGFSGAYDFVYLPIDFQTKVGLGYAIVNMVSHSVALSAQEHLTGFTNWPFPFSKPLEVSWNSPLQGLAAHIDRYRNSPLMHASIPDSYRPVLFQNKVRVDFPAPTTKIRAPRIRHPKADGSKKK